MLAHTHPSLVRVRVRVRVGYEVLREVPFTVPDILDLCLGSSLSRSLTSDSLLSLQLSRFFSFVFGSSHLSLVVDLRLP